MNAYIESRVLEMPEQYFWMLALQDAPGRRAFTRYDLRMSKLRAG